MWHRRSAPGALRLTIQNFDLTSASAQETTVTSSTTADEPDQNNASTVPDGAENPDGAVEPVSAQVSRTRRTARRRVTRPAGGPSVSAADRDPAATAPIVAELAAMRKTEPAAQRESDAEHIVPVLSLEDIVLPAAEANPARDRSAGKAERPAAERPANDPADKSASNTEAEVAAAGEQAAGNTVAAASAATTTEELATTTEEPAATSQGRVATRTGSGRTSRLATTALLFQAPEIDSRAPAVGNEPKAGSSTATVAKKADTAPGKASAKKSSKTKSAATRAKDEELGSGALSGDQPDAAATAKGATEPDHVLELLPRGTELRLIEARKLTKEETKAAEEVAEIESELIAEGVELPEFAASDMVEDSEDVELVVKDSTRRRRRGGRGRRGAKRDGDVAAEDAVDDGEDGAASEDATTAEDDGSEDAATAGASEADEETASSRRRRRRRGARTERPETARATDRARSVGDEVTALAGSTRLEAKRQRRREGRDAGRRRQIITEAEFLARRESVVRTMVVREQDERTQVAVLEDGVLVEHYVSAQAQHSMVGNVYLGRVQNVLPSMEAAFVDIGKGRNAVLYAGEVNWDAAGIESNSPRRIEQALKSGDPVLVQVTKDPIGHKGARLTSQITLAGRYLVLVPGGGMTGISRKLPEVERARLKRILREIVPDSAGVIVRTAAEGASEEELRADVGRLQAQWQSICEKAQKTSAAPVLLQGEPDLAIRVVRDIFNDDFTSLVVQGEAAWQEVSSYIEDLAPDLRDRVVKWTENTDVFVADRVDEQLAKGMDRKVWLPSGGSLVIDRTEAMTVIDVNTGKFTGAGGTLEETVTRNNLEAAEEIVRQLRLRDIGGIIVIDFIDMVLESNRELVLRRLVECLGRDRTRHQVAEVTSLGLVQMTRKRVGQGLVEAFSETCECCKGRGFVLHSEPIEQKPRVLTAGEDDGERKQQRRTRTVPAKRDEPHTDVPVLPQPHSEAREAVKARLAAIAAAAAHAHEVKHPVEPEGAGTEGAEGMPTAQKPVEAEESPHSDLSPANAAAEPKAEHPSEPDDIAAAPENIAAAPDTSPEVTDQAMDASSRDEAAADQLGED